MDITIDITSGNTSSASSLPIAKKRSSIHRGCCLVLLPFRIIYVLAILLLILISVIIYIIVLPVIKVLSIVIQILGIVLWVVTSCQAECTHDADLMHANENWKNCWSQTHEYWCYFHKPSVHQSEFDRALSFCNFYGQFIIPYFELKYMYNTLSCVQPIEHHLSWCWNPIEITDPITQASD